MLQTLKKWPEESLHTVPNNKDVNNIFFYWTETEICHVPLYFVKYK